MDDTAAQGTLAWTIDAVAAAAFGAAVFAASLWLSAGQFAFPAGALAASAGLIGLRRVKPENVTFTFPYAAAPAWDDVLAWDSGDSKDNVLILRAEDQLVPAHSAVGAADIVPASADAGELLRRIDAHLHGDQAAPNLAETRNADVVPFAPDASAALRSALQELRRSVG